MTRKYFIVIFSFLFLLQTESICNYIIPPGTVLLDRKTATYMDASEITVFAWAEYLYWVKENNGENSDEYKNALPDSATCEKLYGPFRYFQHPKYKNYPIVGISYEQVQAYCQWRSDRVNEKNKKGRIIYSLPEVYDYQMAFTKQKRIKNMSTSIIPVNPKKKKLTGIGWNVQELTADPNVIVAGKEGDNLIFDDYRGISYSLGFRCKALIVKE